MTRLFSIAAFSFGAALVAWMGSNFIGNNALALFVSLVIGVTYLGGFIELMRFQQATGSLLAALAATHSKVDDLDAWLARLHPSLRTGVRLRIQGEHISLPGPVITPYLVGLLVMLGLLGTFVGMVDTMKGAVYALEGTSELQAVRQGLAAPIKGLGVAFGTSVAGVAGSAMLGLISMLSRRERILASAQLDQIVATTFQDFSLAHNRQQTFKALQSQAQALPEVVARLDQLAQGLGQMGEHISAALLANQQQFHQSVQGAYQALAEQVGQSLKHSLAESGRLAGESIQPVLSLMMQDIAEQARSTQAALGASVQQQVELVTQQFSQTSSDFKQAWASGLSAQESANQALLEAFEQAQQGWQMQQRQDEAVRLEQWRQQLATSQSEGAAALGQMASAVQAQLLQSGDQQAASLKQLQGEFATLAQALADQWQAAGEAQLLQQQALASSLEQCAQAILHSGQHSTAQLLSEAGRVLQASEQLVQQRLEGEARWLEQQREALAALSSRVTSQLDALHGAEAARGEAAVARLEALNLSVNSGLEAMTARIGEQLAALHGAEQGRAATLVEGFQQLHVAIGERLESLHGAEVGRGELMAARLESMSDRISGHLEALHAAEQIRAEASLSRLQQLNQVVGDKLEALHGAEVGRGEAVAARLDSMSAVMVERLEALHAAEQGRADAALARLAGLEEVVARHLGQLGNALEAPMSRLIETASEAPRAAAEVIEKLRAEISKNIERDNGLLQERQQIMEQLQGLSAALAQTAEGQRLAIEKMVASSSEALNKVSAQFNELVGAKVTQLTDVVDLFAGSAAELASLGEAFGFAVEQFGATNQQLMQRLGQIEQGLENAGSRSDEQLAYYVAQAREVIDHSMLSQQALIAEIRALSRAGELGSGA